jgi:hypothetical protein
MMSLQYPDVPNLPGVPQVNRQPGVTPSTGPVAGTAASQGALWQSSQAAPSWGIFDANGNQVVTPDSVYDFGYYKEWDVPTFPVQSGAPSNPTGFANYNKVELPFELSVRMTKGGTQTDRANFISQVEAISGTTTLYTIRTPEKSYQNCVVSRSELIRRGASGAYFLAEMDVYFTQVLQTTGQYSNTVAQTANAADPTAKPATTQGNVSPQPASSQLQEIAVTAVKMEPLH